MWIIIGFVVLFWIGIKLNRWINGSSKIAKNQEKLLEELKKQNKNGIIMGRNNRILLIYLNTQILPTITQMI